MKKMPKIIAAVLMLAGVLLLISSCAGTPSADGSGLKITEITSPIDFTSAEYSTRLDTFPVSGSPRFFSSVKRMSSRDRETAACLVQASEQASKYIAVKASAKFYSEKVNTSIRYMRDLQVAWDKELALKMIDKLRVIDVFRDTYGTYMITELEGEKIHLVPWKPAPRGRRPAWTNTVPEIPGYLTAVGIALQTGYVADSFAAADDQALEDMARQVSVDISTGRKSIENAVGTASYQSNLEISEAVIAGFYILDRWRTTDGRYYYSLAAAPEIRSFFPE